MYCIISFISLYSIVVHLICVALVLDYVLIHLSHLPRIMHYSNLYLIISRYKVNVCTCGFISNMSEINLVR